MLGITSEIPCGPSSEINCCYHCTDIFLFNSSLRIAIRKSDKLLHILSTRPFSVYSPQRFCLIGKVIFSCVQCKVILMTFLCSCISFEYPRLIGLVDPSTLNPVFYLTMSTSCTSRYRKMNPPAAPGHEFQLMAIALITHAKLVKPMKI